MLPSIQDQHKTILQAYHVTSLFQTYSALGIGSVMI